MPELLLELFSEEIPARMQARAAADLERLIRESLEGDKFEYSGIKAYCTPRRLVLVVDGLPTKIPDTIEKKRGPRSGAPDKAIEGFAKANKVSKHDLQIRTTEKGDFFFAVVEKKGLNTAEHVPLIVETAVINLGWPKSMRWGNSALTWVRPLHRIFVIFDGKPIKDRIQLGTSKIIPGRNPGSPLDRGEREIIFGSKTTGHRFLSPEPFTVKNFADYKTKLLENKVMLDAADRRDKIRADADKLSRDEGLTIRTDEALLDEVAGLVEWPVVLMGRFDEDFLSVPPEVLIAAMRGHQKYFSLLDKDGKLAPRFIVVANIDAPDGGKAITAGNERVLRARLSDAKFFWDQDRKQSLSSRTPKLQSIVFHAKLGTLDEKVDRMQALAVEIATFIPDADKDQVRSAARLAKADLTTAMVGELPELQGLMGRYYALHDGEKEAVADAIADHYSPMGPGDTCPSKPVSIAVALADKIDTLIGFWKIDEKPTGSKDPFALRRAALGVIRLICENDLRLPLLGVFAGAGGKDIGSDLLAFFADRLKVHLKEQGVRHDLIDAVFALGEDDLVRMLARVHALGEFVTSDDGANLLTAYKRAANIVKIEEKKDGRSFDGAAKESVLGEDAEKELFQALEIVEGNCQSALLDEDFTAAMEALANLRKPVDGFFDQVKVNSDDLALRENRLKLLNRIRAVMERVADFSKIEG